MATRNAPFYSCNAGRPETLKSHTKYSAALKAAGEWGQVWMTEEKRQRQAHTTSAGDWRGFPPEHRAADILAEIKRQNLIDGVENAG